MPGWRLHAKWSGKMGIPDDVAEYTNRVIDARKLEDYPDDFVQYAKDLKFDQPRGKLPLELRDLLVIFGTHDFGKNASIKREILPFFRKERAKITSGVGIYTSFWTTW